MKILHVIPSIAKRYGGPSTAIVPMVTEINNIGFEANVVSTDADGPHNSLQLNDVPGSLPIQLFRRDFSESWKVSIQMWRWLHRNVKNYDLVHIHAIWSFSTNAAVSACIRHNVPFVVRPAGMLSGYSWRNKGLKKQIYWKLLGEKMARNAAAFHATSPGESEDIKRVCPQARVFVIPNGVEDAAFEYPVRTETNFGATDQSSDKDLPVLLYLSRLHPKKGIVDRLLPAIAEMQTKVRLLIVGDDDGSVPSYQSEIEQTIRSLGLSDRVTILGAVSGDDRWPYFDLADIFVLPSHSENFGIVVVEAMARGCPVVTTHDVQVAPLVEQANAGVILTGESSELAHSLEDLLNKPELRAKMGESGKEYTRKFLQWSNIAEQIAAMYSAITQEA